jgi:hypothetical protein
MSGEDGRLFYHCQFMRRQAVRVAAVSLPEQRCGSGRALRVRNWLVREHPGRGIVSGGTQEQRMPGGQRSLGGQHIPGGQRSPGLLRQ